MAMKWTDDKLRAIKNLVECGYTAREISGILSAEYGECITVSMVNNAKDRNGLARYLMEPDPRIKVYDEEIRLDGADTMVTSDWHSPHHSEENINLMLQKVGGILYNRSIQERDPTAYIKNKTKAYIRKRFDYVNEGLMRQLIEDVYDIGYDEESIINIARACRSWSQFKYAIEDMMRGL